MRPLPSSRYVPISSTCQASPGRLAPASGEARARVRGSAALHAAAAELLAILAVQALAIGLGGAGLGYLGPLAGGRRALVGRGGLRLAGRLGRGRRGGVLRQ